MTNVKRDELEYALDHIESCLKTRLMDEGYPGTWRKYGSYYVLRYMPQDIGNSIQNTVKELGENGTWIQALRQSQSYLRTELDDLSPGGV